MDASVNGSASAVGLEEIQDALQYLAVRRMSDVAALLLTLVTVVLICIAALGNSFTIYVIVTQREMRSAKYGFILNLACSDLLLCLFTEPFNLVLTLERTWRFGVFLCRFIMVCQGMSVFASSFSITAIAVDRLHVVMRRRVQSRLEKKRVLPSIALIWLISVALALPCYFFMELKPLEFDSVSPQLVAMASESLGIGTDMCKPSEEGFYAKFYSIFCLVVQFLINFLIISGTHCAIWLKVVQRKKKMAQSRNESRRFAQAKRASAARRKKAKYLLLCISLTFVVSWLPLNLLNLALDFITPDTTSGSDASSLAIIDSINSSRFLERSGLSTQTSGANRTGGVQNSGEEDLLQLGWNLATSLEQYEFVNGRIASSDESELMSITDVLFPAANVLSLLSAVLNPVYYGWFNHHFRRHFLRCIAFILRRPLHEHQDTAAARRSDSDELRSRRNTNTNTLHSPRSTCATPVHPSMSRENGLSSVMAGDLHSLHPPLMCAKPPCKRNERIVLYDINQQSTAAPSGKCPQIRIVLESDDDQQNGIVLQPLDCEQPLQCA